jgi:hypothetical protein
LSSLVDATSSSSILSFDEKNWKEIRELSEVCAFLNEQKSLKVSAARVLNPSEDQEVFLLTVAPDHNFLITKNDIPVHNFAFAIPVLTWTIGEGIKFICLTAFATILGQQLLQNIAKKVIDDAGGNTSGFNPTYVSSVGPIKPKKPKKNGKKDNRNQNRDKKNFTDKTESENKKITLYEKNSKHIFRNSEGHFKSDTHENRKLLLEISNDKSNFLGIDKYGSEWYAKITNNGKQIWTQVRNREIRNAGINDTPRDFSLYSKFPGQ